MATVGQIIVGGIHSLYLILSFSKSIRMQLWVLKMVKKKQVPSLKKLVYESMDKVTGKPKELPILVQYLGIKDEDQLKFSTKSTKEY